MALRANSPSSGRKEGHFQSKGQLHVCLIWFKDFSFSDQFQTLVLMFLIAFCERNLALIRTCLHLFPEKACTKLCSDLAAFIFVA